MSRHLVGFSQVLNAWLNREPKTLKNDRTNGHVIYYYHTDIIGRDERGTYVNHGGYTTPTTKTRINHLDVVHVYQKNYQWYISTPGSRGEYFPFDGKVYITESPKSLKSALEVLGVV